MPESDVRLVIGCIFHGDQSDGLFPDKNEGEAKVHGLHQRIRLLHGRCSTDATPGRRSRGLDLTMQMYRRRSEAHVEGDRGQVGAGTRYSTHHGADISTAVQQHVPRCSETVALRRRVCQHHQCKSSLSSFQLSIR